VNRNVVATPLFARHLQEFLTDYAEKGAVRFVERLQASYQSMVDNISSFDEIGQVRRRTVNGKTLTIREYVLDAGARDFLVLYFLPTDPLEPVVLLNIRIGGQNPFRWKR
jgi:hypothetical protein